METLIAMISHIHQVCVYNYTLVVWSSSQSFDKQISGHKKGGGVRGVG